MGFSGGYVWPPDLSIPWVTWLPKEHLCDLSAVNFFFSPGMTHSVTFEAYGDAVAWLWKPFCYHCFVWSLFSICGHKLLRREF